MPMQVIRKSSKDSNSSKNMKSIKKRTKKHQRGGAIYSFDLNDKIGGLPANIPLNGTSDGDCPGYPTSELGFVNYGLTRGGDRSSSHRHKSHRHKSHLHKSHNHKSHNHKSHNHKSHNHKSHRNNSHRNKKSHK